MKIRFLAKARHLWLILVNTHFGVRHVPDIGEQSAKKENSRFLQKNTGKTKKWGTTWKIDFSTDFKGCQVSQALYC